MGSIKEIKICSYAWQTLIPNLKKKKKKGTKNSHVLHFLLPRQKVTWQPLEHLDPLVAWYYLEVSFQN